MNSDSRRIDSSTASAVTSAEQAERHRRRDQVPQRVRGEEGREQDRDRRRVERVRGHRILARRLQLAHDQQRDRRRACRWRRAPAAAASRAPSSTLQEEHRGEHQRDAGDRREQLDADQALPVEAGAGGGAGRRRAAAAAAGAARRRRFRAARGGRRRSAWRGATLDAAARVIDAGRARSGGATAGRGGVRPVDARRLAAAARRGARLAGGIAGGRHRRPEALDGDGRSRRSAGATMGNGGGAAGSAAPAAAGAAGRSADSAGSTRELGEPRPQRAQRRACCSSTVARAPRRAPACAAPTPTTRSAGRTGRTSSRPREDKNSIHPPGRWAVRSLPDCGIRRDLGELIRWDAVHLPALRPLIVLCRSIHRRRTCLNSREDSVSGGSSQGETWQPSPAGHFQAARDRRRRRLGLRQDHRRPAHRRKPRRPDRSPCSSTIATIAIATTCGSRSGPRSTTTIPDSLETDLLVAPRPRAARGPRGRRRRPTTSPATRGSRHTETIHPRRAIIVEGILIFTDAALRAADGRQGVRRHRRRHALHPAAAARHRRARAGRCSRSSISTWAP